MVAFEYEELDRDTKAFMAWMLYRAMWWRDFAKI